MRKLVIVIIAILAVFTFLREYPSQNQAPRSAQRASVDSSPPN